MVIKKYSYIAALTYFLVSLSGAANAIEQLNYTDNIGPTLKQQVSKFLIDNYKIDINIYKIAYADLNNDGIDEYILREKGCQGNKSKCTYLIIAEAKDKIVLLSKIQARNIVIGETNTNGIKNILSFGDKNNDYGFDIYMWSPEDKMYILNIK